jgi:hypothetical protein
MAVVPSARTVTPNETLSSAPVVAVDVEGSSVVVLVESPASTGSLGVPVDVHEAETAVTE